MRIELRSLGHNPELLVLRGQIPTGYRLGDSDQPTLESALRDVVQGVQGTVIRPEDSQLTVQIRFGGSGPTFDGKEQTTAAVIAATEDWFERYALVAS